MPVELFSNRLGATFRSRVDSSRGRRAASSRIVPPPGGPSPFSLADCDATAALLAGAGFTDVSTEAGPDDAGVGTDDDLHELASRLLERNPATSAALRSAEPDVRDAAVQAAVDVLAPHAADGLVRMAAASWIVSAIRS